MGLGYRKPENPNVNSLKVRENRKIMTDFEQRRISGSLAFR